ncbi:MAG: bifunctional diaminohydroxyphosphoribosylaminopyrimidine deaminase/5-amino-6-(5-phosphoribosylamino)uracil reductase RibD [Rhodospirillales bacterium]|nr:bifunctional diaminohydroxyphosphoribosylaminopyrimidine deaminase/5-amino-6-(5-phosphoribosylamino)uracil reductase RibD [Rhodospirillales bacterium]
MAGALALARRGLGRAWPNPAVGCVIVQEGRVVGRGWTQPGGRPHAETEALGRADDRARGASAYVTLEPCSHHGETPPCADALIAAGVRHVVAAMEDPDPRVSGQGLARLRAAGIAVDTGPLADVAAEINAGFLLRVRAGRPLVTFKTATTLDGRIATHTGESRWITGEDARARAHALRAENDAIMVGIGTAVADDPQLTCRLPGMEACTPVRIVIDGRLRLPLTAKLVATAAATPTWLVTLADAPRERYKAFADCGVEVITVPAGEGDQPDMAATLQALGARGLTRVLVEGGGHLAAALFRASLIDRIVWFRAARLIGGDGVPAAVAFGVDRLADAPGFVRRSVEPCGEDVVETYVRRS